ncbi:translation initiation factor IF-2-like [Bubalus bubalis]|uniref:translation initiation factor IF-2-like n=1 Tax=Bubalus bubalis TaxID=89462 RepID=UPI000DBC734C|nr:uncharacterized protein LOC112581571 [Bubalus bubalis]XP_045020046.1 translation initiation factor IF-2-like [Bubalus bubalis]
MLPAAPLRPGAAPAPSPSPPGSRGRLQASAAEPSRGGGARGADWQSGRRRPGNGSGFSGGVTRREGAAAAAAAAENAAESRAGGQAKERARPPQSSGAAGSARGVAGPARRLLSRLAGPGRPEAAAFLRAPSVRKLRAKFGGGNAKPDSFLPPAPQIRAQPAGVMPARLRSLGCA